MIVRLFFAFCLCLLLSCKSTTYFIVRHAEKEGSGTAMMQSDPPLSAAGQKQAQDLKRFLEGKKIKTIYSTNYARTVATAEPIRQALRINLKTYDPRANEQFVADLKKISDGNVLVVGHSNTVDDVVNGLMGENKMSDLRDDEYGNVFIVTRKGSTFSFERLKVPQATSGPTP